MKAYDLYKDISERTQGDLYIGIVGPVRTGKSTFIQRFMEKIVIPGIQNAHVRARVLDELPQSGSGRTVMTTKPAFVPNEAAEVYLTQENPVRLRLIDSVGYMIEGALGTQDENSPRMVKTPWSPEEMSFDEAAEIGTKKVIGEHSTIGLVLTTDGTVTELPRSAYVEAEARVVDELKALDKPFIVVMNTKNPDAPKTAALRKSLERDYCVPVVAMNAAQMEEEDIQNILEQVLDQFEVIKLSMHTPEWLGALEDNHRMIKSLMDTISAAVPEKLRIGDTERLCKLVEENEYVSSVSIRQIDHGSGEAQLQINLMEGLFNQVLAEQCGTEIKSDAHLLSLMRELVDAKRQYDQVANAIHSVEETGYGIVSPRLEEMSLQEPEIMKQGGRFGVRLRASAPSLHMIRVDIETEVCPVVGTEQQSEELIKYLMDGFEQDPQKLWQSNLFGKPLADLVREGLANKLAHMPADTQAKMQQTLQKIINEGNGTMLCVLL